MLHSDSAQIWHGDEGRRVQIDVTNTPCVIVLVEGKDFTICESCYILNKYLNLPLIDVAEVHYEFGLDYRDRELWDRSKTSLERAARLSPRIKILESLAYVYNKSGEPNQAIKLYKNILAICPTSFIAKENLKILNRQRQKHA